MSEVSVLWWYIPSETRVSYLSLIEFVVLISSEIGLSSGFTGERTPSPKSYSGLPILVVIFLVCLILHSLNIGNLPILISAQWPSIHLTLVPSPNTFFRSYTVADLTAQLNILKKHPT